LKPFFDTNILVYAQQRSGKAEQARALLAAGGVVSVQVLNEFAAVSRRKLGKDWREIAEALEDARALVGPPIPLTLPCTKRRSRWRAIMASRSMMR
jgi:predicted nucleic acid-binding protein